MRTIDLNADLGENTPERVVADDAAMLQLVTSANVACGFHAGAPNGIKNTLTAAAAAGVIVGAHPGYNDFAGFGRTYLPTPQAQLQAELEYQLGAVSALAKSAGTSVRYVKPHGALYNRIAHDSNEAKVLAAAVRAIDSNLPVLGLAASAGQRVLEQAGITVYHEIFADRAYTAAGTLLSRSEPGAVLTDAATVAARMLQFVEAGKLTAITGEQLRLPADSICLHGDSPGAVALAASVGDVLTSAGVQLRAFAAE